MRIRQATTDDWKGIARVHVDCMRTAYQDILPSKVIEKFTYTDREERWQKDLPKSTSGGTMTFVVVDTQDNVVGFALGGTMRDPRLRIKYTGELYGIYIHPDVQGQGLGKKLFESIAEFLSSLHHSRMALWTFEDHPSCDFFKSLHGNEVYNKKTTIAGNELNEHAYGWDDIETFSFNKKEMN
ncbi:GNAT family N-acetyltransferase [Bacillus shivajii]|uniref:GNAT family N-acetyltransferase n=1 Tax=Bacillus shivajii TaxID=1983719 RepID=UPI001CFA9A09|nr:GNAT family N-acetyltransferase [Bacillus shivajii]UCZ54934.1 GNAT family N-acetyltransferase [Bacillus shivajii]